MKKSLFALVSAFWLLTSPLSAQEVNIASGFPGFDVETEDGPVRIERNQDTQNTIHPDFALTSRPCPNFCIQRMSAGEGVETVGEREIFDLLQAKTAIMMDARTEEWHFKGTIPGSLNLPYVEVHSRLDEIGCEKGKSWDCSNAKTVIVYCNGPWCGQSHMAIKSMLREGYPADKIKYYRGGMQAWHSFGLTVVEGGL